jgi:hypothetical protein
MDIYKVDDISVYLNKKCEKITNNENKKKVIKCQIEKDQEKVDDIVLTIDEIIQNRIIKSFSSLLNEKNIKDISCQITGYDYRRFNGFQLNIKYYDYDYTTYIDDSYDYNYTIQIYDDYIKVGKGLDGDLGYPDGDLFIRYFNHKKTGCIDMDKVKSEGSIINRPKYPYGKTFNCSCGCHSKYSLRYHSSKQRDYDLYYKLESIVISLEGLYKEYKQVRYNMFHFPILKFERMTMLILCANKYKDGILSSIPRDVFLIIAKEVFKGRFEKN